MDEFDAAETVKRFWVENVESIPSQQIVMARCPFCGKADRIRILPPEESLPAESRNDAYRASMCLLTRSERTVAICGFCMNIVLLKEGLGERPGQD